MGKIKPKTLLESSRYEDFIKGRDKELEEILAKYTRAINLGVETLKARTQEIASHIGTKTVYAHSFVRNRKDFESKIDYWFKLAIQHALMLIVSLRRTTYVISYIGQAEAIARALGKNTVFSLTSKELDEIAQSHSPSGGQLHHRIELAYSRLKNKVLEAFHLSQVLESPIEETLERIAKAFPSSQGLKTWKKVMAPMKEADRTLFKADKVYGAVGTIEPSDWEKVLADYTSEELPADDYMRGPYDKIFYAEQSDEGIETYTRYSWEVEKEVTEDFVQKVRDGEMDAANENGINDFQWIAIIDDKTDDCCLWRDGLTTQEIIDALDGEHSDDDCDAETPPAHFNCRCRLAPMTEDLPAETPPDFGDFQSWLDDQAGA